MCVVELIGEPCGWNRLAPARLRQQVFGTGVAWQTYSTSRYLEELHPKILHAIEPTDASPSSVINVELLPPVLAGRWQSVALRFATETEINDSGLPELLARSLDLIQANPSVHGTVTALCRSLHVLVAAARDFDASYSDPCLPFSVFVSCPLTTERNRVERLTENLVHEALHLQLSLVESVDALIVEASDGETILSPWRNEPRTVRGLLHAVYVFGNLRCFWRSIAASRQDSSTFAEWRIETIDKELADAIHLLKSRSLTPTGRQLAKSFLASCESARLGGGTTHR